MFIMLCDRDAIIPITKIISGTAEEVSVFAMNGNHLHHSRVGPRYPGIKKAMA